MDIYGTIGPACAQSAVLTEMFRLGMTGMRLNLSHTDLQECREWTDMIKKAAEAAGVSPRLLVDLQGPELRIGVMEAPMRLKEGEEIFLFFKDGSGAGDRGGIPVPRALQPVLEPGQQVLLDDGRILLKVTGRSVKEDGQGNVLEYGKGDSSKEDLSQGKVPGSQDGGSAYTDSRMEGVCCRVQRGGILTSRKSIALPGIELDLPALTESDRRNIREAKSHGVTGVMLPFVRSSLDLKKLRQELVQAGAAGLEVFAKIENLDGVRNLKSLLPEADEIVIARGDLGNRMPLWELPAVQAEIARVCREAGKPFMVVTQMLASMENSRVPTRAEVSDIFRAVAEGASSLMVTGETASGRYPVETMEYLCRTEAYAREYLAGRPGVAP